MSLTTRESWDNKESLIPTLIILHKKVGKATSPFEIMSVWLKKSHVKISLVRFAPEALSLIFCWPWYDVTQGTQLAFWSYKFGRKLQLNVDSVVVFSTDIK